jgi:sugar phosphate isomerase/epimerase
MVPGVEQIVALFRAGEAEEANRNYREAIEGIRVLIELIQNIRQTGMVDEEPLSPDGKGLGDLADDLRKTLEELVAAQGEGDSERIADALEFELIEQLRNWRNSLPELRRLVEERGGAVH